MSFDWIRFLQAHNIEYDDSGAHHTKGVIGIQCPFCGYKPGYKPLLGINLAGHGWKCWRDPSHYGRSPVGLIQVLLKCTWEQARAHAGLEHTYIPEDWCSQALALLDPPPVPKRKPLRLPTEFLEFNSERHSLPFAKYLNGRGFTVSDARHNGVHYCLSGPFRYRVIFPVYFGGKLVSWTGRTINDAIPRYRSHTVDPEKAYDDGYEPALGPINHYLLWYDSLALGNYHTLVLCEGPMDAWRVTCLGASHGFVATCFFGAEPTDPQIELLHDIAGRFKRRVVLLDRGAEAMTVKVASKLKALKVEAGFMLPGRKDPGKLRDLGELRQCLGEG